MLGVLPKLLCFVVLRDARLQDGMALNRVGWGLHYGLLGDRFTPTLTGASSIGAGSLIGRAEGSGYLLMLCCAQECSPTGRDGAALSRLGGTLWLAWGQVHPYLDWGQLNCKCEAVCLGCSPNCCEPLVY